MENHLKNIADLLSYTHREIASKPIIFVLAEKTHKLIDIVVLLRDMQNFISYLKFIISAPVIPKKLQVDIILINLFVERIYVGFDENARETRAAKMFEFINARIGRGAEVNAKNIGILEGAVSSADNPAAFEKLKDYILVALLLKWFNNALVDKLSKNLEDYVVYLATIFGQLQSGRLLNIENEIPRVMPADEKILSSAYTFFEAALREGIRMMNRNIAKVDASKTIYEQFQIVFVCLDRLIKDKENSDVKKFRDKLIVSTALIYLQDEYVARDPEAKKLVDLLISMYYQFRDKRGDV